MKPRNSVKVIAIYPIVKIAVQTAGVNFRINSVSKTIVWLI